MKGEIPMSQSLYIECGKIVNTHGCYGGLKLESWCNSPQDLAELKTVFLETESGIQPYHVVKSSVFKQFIFSDRKVTFLNFIIIF